MIVKTLSDDRDGLGDEVTLGPSFRKAAVCLEVGVQNVHE